MLSCRIDKQNELTITNSQNLEVPFWTEQTTLFPPSLTINDNQILVFNPFLFHHHLLLLVLKQGKVAMFYWWFLKHWLVKMAWRKGCEEVANSKPLFLTIYTVVVIGIVVSSFYVFSAIYSSNPSAAQSSAWLSSLPSMCFLKNHAFSCSALVLVSFLNTHLNFYRCYCLDNDIYFFML